MKKRTIQKVLVLAALCSLQSVYSMDYVKNLWRWLRARSPQVTSVVSVSKKADTKPDNYMIYTLKNPSIVLTDLRVDEKFTSAIYLSFLAMFRRTCIALGEIGPDVLPGLANLIIDRAIRGLDNLTKMDSNQIKQDIVQPYIIDGYEYYAILDWDTLLHGSWPKIKDFYKNLRAKVENPSDYHKKKFLYEIADYFNQIINQLNNINWLVAKFRDPLYKARLDDIAKLGEEEQEVRKPLGKKAEIIIPEGLDVLEHRELKLTCEVPGLRRAQMKARAVGTAAVTVGAIGCVLGTYLASQSEAGEKAAEVVVPLLGTGIDQ